MKRIAELEEECRRRDSMQENSADINLRLNVAIFQERCKQQEQRITGLEHERDALHKTLSDVINNVLAKPNDVGMLPASTKSETDACSVTSTTIRSQWDILASNGD